ncbi:MAG: sigma-54 dependent transcriptional regulator [Gemmatimonadota bacterium]|jgi:DNA-binding NtrC family response regulator
MAERKILVVDDEDRVCASLSRALSDGRTEVRTAGTAERALAAVADDSPDLVISDIRMPGMDGLELLGVLRERLPGVDVVLMTAYDDLATAAVAMREGASDFLVKPLDLHQLRAVTDRVFRDRAARAPPRGGERDEKEPGGPTPGLVGRHPSMVELFKRIGQLAAHRTTVLIRGESGTGKELIARAIHGHSPAADEPFVAVNCTALPTSLLESELFGHVEGAFTGASSDRRGRFAIAGRGTIFLDEIGDTSPEFQAKLLRVLEEHEFYPVGAERAVGTEARVLAATHRNLEELVEEGRFREDLYYRLRVVELKVPPLRDRMEDVPVLARHLIRKGSRAVEREPPGLSDEALETLMAHDWPGNVRELENCLVRAVVLATGGIVRPAHLGLGEVLSTTPRLRSLEEVEREHVGRVLEAAGGNRTRAAEILRISRPRLRRMIDKYGLD